MMEPLGEWLRDDSLSSARRSALWTAIGDRRFARRRRRRLLHASALAAALVLAGAGAYVSIAGSSSRSEPAYAVERAPPSSPAAADTAVPPVVLDNGQARPVTPTTPDPRPARPRRERADTVAVVPAPKARTPERSRPRLKRKRPAESQPAASSTAPPLYTVGGPGLLREIASDASSVLFEHVSGQVDIEVRSDGRRWRFRSTPFEVEVLGTRFSLDKTSTALNVAVSEGRVAVTRIGSKEPGVVLSGGAQMSFPRPSPEAAAQAWARIDYLRKAGRHQEAIERLMAMLDGPGPAERGHIWFTVGLCHLDRGDDAAAKAAFQEAMSCDDLSPALRQRAGSRLESLGAPADPKR